ADVELEGVQAPAAAELGQRPLDVIGAQIGDDDVHPGVQARRRDAKPDPARAAGDEGGPPLEVRERRAHRWTPSGHARRAAALAARRPSSKRSRVAGGSSRGSAARASSKISRSSASNSGWLKM